MYSSSSAQAAVPARFPSAAPVPFAHVSTAGTDHAAAQVAQLQRQRERQASHLSSAEVAVHRAGWSRLVRISDFVASHAALQARLDAACSALENAPGQQPPDLDVEDLRVDAPFECIQKAIDREVERVMETMQKESDAKANQLAAEKAKAREQLALQKQQKRAQALQLQQQREAQAMAHAVAAGLAPMGAATIAMAAIQQQQSKAAEPAQATAPQQQPPVPALPSEQKEQQPAQPPPDEEMMDTQPAQIDASQQSVSAAVRAGGSGAPLEEDLTLSQLQPTQQVLLSQSQLDHPSTTAQAPPAGAPAATEESPSFATSAAGGSRSVKSGLDLPPDFQFGEGIPHYRDLLNPLQPFLEARARQLGKRTRADVNCMTVALQQHDKQAKLKVAGGMSAGTPMSLAKDEVILRVALYHPHRHTKQQEFLVLGSQPLTALRDALHCLRDKVLDGPHTPSSCFFIENVFYDDLRQPNAIRLSDPVVQWLHEGGEARQTQLGLFRQESMEDTRFADLSVRLGAHYFFQHQGDCRHVLIVTELRMAHKADEQDPRVYPLRVFQARSRFHMCDVCDQLPAAYVAYGDKLAEASPCFYCEQCYEALHYSKEGQLLYDDFQVFPYEQD